MKAKFNSYSKEAIFKWLIPLLVIAVTLTTSLLVFYTINGLVRHNLLSTVDKNFVKEKWSIKPGLPRQLIIPSININVAVDYVGLTADGAMDIGPNSKVVGWYMLGPRPGDNGNAVIAGHYGFGSNGETAIFNDIQKLNKGDELSVVDQKGQSINFVVREIRKYNPNSDASDVFKSKDGNKHLNLITCNGVWENDKQSYSDRLVVFTDIKV